MTIFLRVSLGKTKLHKLSSGLLGQQEKNLEISSEAGFPAELVAVMSMRNGF